jgi:hypothetical protein
MAGRRRIQRYAFLCSLDTTYRSLRRQWLQGWRGPDAAAAPSISACANPPSVRLGPARKATSIRQRKYDLKPMLIYERYQGSDPFMRNEIALPRPIEDLIFLVILLC